MAGRCDIIRALGLATHVQSGCSAVIGSNSTRKNHCRGLSFRFGGSRGRETGRGSVHVANPVSRFFRALASADEAKNLKQSNRGDWAMVHCAAVESWLFSLEQRKSSKSQQNPLDFAGTDAKVIGMGLKHPVESGSRFPSMAAISEKAIPQAWCTFGLYGRSSDRRDFRRVFQPMQAFFLRSETAREKEKHKNGLIERRLAMHMRVGGLFSLENNFKSARFDGFEEGRPREDRRTTIGVFSTSLNSSFLFLRENGTKKENKKTFPIGGVPMTREKCAVCAEFTHENNFFSLFFKNSLDIAKNNANVVGKGLKSLNRAAAADIGETSVTQNKDRSFRGRSGQRKLGVSLFTISTRPSFFRALKCAGKGYSNPQIEEVTTW